MISMRIGFVHINMIYTMKGRTMPQSFLSGAPLRRRTKRNTRFSSIEQLEPRFALYALTPSAWSNKDMSVSFLPDGTQSEGYVSNLFAKLDGIAATSVWQREFARALQTWANVTPLNFHFVGDDGS